MAASISSVLTMGFGSTGSTALVLTLGFGSATLVYGPLLVAACEVVSFGAHTCEAEPRIGPTRIETMSFGAAAVEIDNR